MNKKFSTLVATLLLSGALFTLNAATFNDDVFKDKYQKEVVGDITTYKLTSNVMLAYDNPLIISEDNVVVDGQDNKYTLKGQIIITGENVTVKNLNVIFVNEGLNGSTPGIDGTTPQAKNAILLVAKSGTLTGNVITSSAKEATCNANAICVLPTDAKGTYTISGNTVTANSITSHAGIGKTVSAGIVVWANMPAGDYTKGSVALETPIDLSKNTYKDCSADFIVEALDKSYNTVVESIQVTPLVKDGKIINGAALTGADGLNYSTETTSIVFNGSAEQLVEAIGDADVQNSSIKTNEGVVVSGVTLPDAVVDGFELVKTPAADQYYLLIVKAEEWDGVTNFVVTADENGKAKVVSAKNLASLITDANLWKMEQALDKDGDYTFIFTNKAGKKMTVDGKNFFHSVANVPYNNGVVFKMDGEDLTTQNPRYFGLYKAGTHALTAKDLYFFEKTGFTITIDGKLAGDPFTGNRLAPMTWNGTGFVKAADNETAVSLRFKNADDEYEYIVAKKTNAGGTAVNQFVYAFTTVSEKDLIAERKLEAKKRTMFDVFTTFHKPVSADDNLETLTSIDSMTVQVLNKDEKLQAAPVGYFKLTTDGTKTLGASIEYNLFPIKINMGNNVVNPADFLKNAFFTITKLDEKGNTIYAVNGCEQRGWVKEVNNELDAQWAITYDAEKALYTAVNREDKDVYFTFTKNSLRENGNKTDDIYTDGEDLYKIEAVKDAKESDGYNWLGDVKNQRYAIAHFSSVYDNNAWISTDKEGNATLDLDREDAVEMIAYEVVDTIKVESTVGYYAGTTYKTAKHTLKVPVYGFRNVANKGFAYDWNVEKYTFTGWGWQSLAIRKDGDKYNLRLVNEYDNNLDLACQKIYAGTSTNFLANCPLYDVNNSLFIVEPLNRPEYRRLGETVANDGFKDMNVNLAKFFRTNVENTFLYENSANRNANNGNGIAKDSLNFLGEVNLSDKPASSALPLFVDTAFVRDETTKPLYMLAVRNSDWMESEKVVAPCDATSHKHITAEGEETDDANKCVHATKVKVHSRTADYLVALTDTAYQNVNDRYPVANPQALYQGNVRLAFVPATHFENDTMVIANSKYYGTKEAANDTLCFVNEKGEQQMNAATFAFRLVDPAAEDGAFYIEAEPIVYNYEGGSSWSQPQYVRIHNSVPVLVTDLDQAATFNVEATDEQATSNESVEAATVKVIATNGAVIVKGAEGKKVVISNVLGQTIANMVITSSEATIAAPAGYVTVAVEGEAAVKAIVK
ncbi:DUF6383 domain-containing protein [uncultured Parabacteroides sp.]|uniref:DUF6383 domain-containing protein n=1 Tax=uncultured Parabacteroides sp. TaxID=512312 RepID=UPI002593054F|nr:DUF6383 domain-containing protein [uncultured Parabacteroides sp.]